MVKPEILDLRILLDKDIQISDILKHPDEPKLYISSYDGFLYCFGLQEDLKLVLEFESRPFIGAIRRMALLPAKKSKVIFWKRSVFLIIVELAVGAADGRICFVDIATGKPKLRLDKLFPGSGASITALAGLDETDTLVAIGNESGDVKIIDLKNLEKPVVASFDNLNDAVSDLVHFPHKKTLVCSGADGAFLVVDLKKYKMIANVEPTDDEMTCMIANSNNAKILCGTAQGWINIYGFNFWGEMQNRLPLHAAQVNCLALDTVSSTILFSGCADGIVRELNINNSKFVLELADLDESVEKIILVGMGDSLEKRYLVACTCVDSLLHVISLSERNPASFIQRTVNRKGQILVDAKDTAESGAARDFFAEL